MAITSDQPISAGNLKAALDGLTGGSLLSYKVLYSSTATNDSVTATLADSVEGYDALVICCETYVSDDGYSAVKAASVTYWNNKRSAFNVKLAFDEHAQCMARFSGTALEWSKTNSINLFPRLILGLKL